MHHVAIQQEGAFALVAEGPSPRNTLLPSAAAQAPGVQLGPLQRISRSPSAVKAGVCPPSEPIGRVVHDAQFGVQHVHHRPREPSGPQDWWMRLPSTT